MLGKTLSQQYSPLQKRLEHVHFLAELESEKDDRSLGESIPDPTTKSHQAWQDDSKSQRLDVAAIPQIEPNHPPTVAKTAPRVVEDEAATSSDLLVAIIASKLRRSRKLLDLTSSLKVLAQGNDA
jgi:hypothetical protein